MTCESVHELREMSNEWKIFLILQGQSSYLTCDSRVKSKASWYLIRHAHTSLMNMQARMYVRASVSDLDVCELLGASILPSWRRMCLWARGLDQEL